MTMNQILFKGAGKAVLLSLALLLLAFGSIAESSYFPKVTPKSVIPTKFPLPTDTDLTGYGEKERAYVEGREFGEIGFFEDKIGDKPVRVKEVRADSKFTAKTDNTKAVQAALNWASKPKKGKVGGVVRLLPAKSGNNRFSLAQITVPSNIRIEVHPDVILEMRGYKARKGSSRNYLFSVGRSRGPKKLMKERVENVEITSMDPNRPFLIDAQTNMPHNYGYMTGGNGNGVVNLTRAIAVGLGYVKNFKIANIDILDNHTESVAIQMFADSDFKDGAAIWRYSGKPVFLEDVYVKSPKKKNKPMYSDGELNKRLKVDKQNRILDEKGNVIPDMFAIHRNKTYGRTPIKGTIKNITSAFSHTGYGTVQVYGGDWIEIDNIEAFNGIAVRVEAGNGTNKDNSNRAGPYYTAASNIKISNIKVTNGFTGVWLKAHAKVHKNISVHNIEAIDSATALLVGKGSFGCKTKCRDLTRGRINNLSITGDIILRQTKFDQPVAEVGNLATYVMTQANMEWLAKKSGKKVEQLSRNDLQSKKPHVKKMSKEQAAKLKSSDFDVASGSRWYLMFPTAPVLAFAQYSATEIGDQSAKVGYFPVDLSHANIISEGLPHNKKVFYRSDMHYPNGKPALDFINK